MLRMSVNSRKVPRFLFHMAAKGGSTEREPQVEAAENERFQLSRQDASVVNSSRKSPLGR